MTKTEKEIIKVLKLITVKLYKGVGTINETTQLLHKIKKIK